MAGRGGLALRAVPAATAAAARFSTHSTGHVQGWRRLRPVHLHLGSAGGGALRRWAAHEAAAERPEPEPLIVPQASNVGKLAGAVAGRMRESGTSASLGAVGPAACHNAIKALALAAQYLQEEAKGRHLASSVQKKDMKSREPEKEASVGVLFRAQWVKDPPIDERPNIFVAGKTNVGILAGSMAKLIETTKTATLAGMGAATTSNTIKAVLIAEGYISKETPNTRLALIPRVDKFDERGVERTRILFHCFRLPP